MTNPDLTDENSNGRKSGSKLRMTLLISGLALITICPIFVLILVGMGQVEGIEFSPDDFSRRKFNYNQIPIVDWVIVKKTYRDVTEDLEKDLVSGRLIIPVINKKKNWDLVSETTTTGLISHECDARFLIGYLEKADESGASYWETWNLDYPKCAKIFWPMVADLARDQMYLKIAGVMRVAIDVSEDKPADFKPLLNKAVSEVYLELGTLDMESDQLERAKYRLSRSIDVDSTPLAVKMHADCLEQLGE